MDTLTTRTSVVTFRCDKTALADGLALAFRATSPRVGLAALSGVLLRAHANGEVLLAATDGEITIETKLVADVRVEGEAVLHRLFGEIIRLLPDGAVDISVDDSGTAQIGTSRSRFTLRTYPREDFPELVELSSPIVEIPIGDLAPAIDQTVVAASTDKGRPVLLGVLMETDGQGVRLVATDSYRLAVRQLDISGFLGSSESVILPARGLAELSREIVAAGSGATVGVGVGERQVAFHIGDTVITTTLINGDFPSYRQLLPERCPNRLEIDRVELLESLRRVGLLARESTPVRLSMGPSGTRLQAMDPELGGEADEELDAEYTGEEMTIAFNPEYFRAGVEACRSERVVIEASEPLKPALLSEADTDVFGYLLMPVRV